MVTQKRYTALRVELQNGRKIIAYNMTDKKLINIFTQGPVTTSFIAESIQKHSSKTNIGAHSIFLGQVRSDDIKGKKITAIEYSTYEEMALVRMQTIRESIFEKYDLACMHVHHSL